MRPIPHPLGQLELDDQQLRLEGVPYQAVRELGRGKSAISWLYQRQADHPSLPRELVLKRYCQTGYETVPFDQILDFELCSYLRLMESGIPHPHLLAYSQAHYALAKEYIAGELIVEIQQREGLDDRHFGAMLQMAGRLQAAGYHVDFFPTNFVLNERGLHYIDYEAHPYSEEWNFANWGIFYWLNREGMAAYLSSGEVGHINKPGEPKPLEAPFLRQRESILRRLS
ncbi:hypothetical protein ABHF91_00230 [Pseudaeromonas sp. ZJS20]|uniref:hypothetical protein n=1 Tax=Pseudaeromonas aegiceratis TaxID=3153928 RepID=UPI00390C93D2